MSQQWGVLVIVQSLARYYDILAVDDSVKIPKPGYSPAKISFALVISKDGELTNIIDLRTDGKKKQPKMMEVPYQKSRAVTVTPYFACDNAKYIFGIEKVKEDPKKGFSPQDFLSVLEEKEKEKIVVSKRSRKCYEQFRTLHHSLLDVTTDAGIQTFLRFIDGWKPEKSLNNPKVSEYKDEILAGGFFVFEIEGTYLHRCPVIRQSWDSHYAFPATGESADIAQCLVSGKEEPIAKTHQKIKGVVDAQPAGASLVSFNNDAFCSYGKNDETRYYNAPISQSAMFKYTTTLNHLLEHESKNRLQIGDTTTVFWAETDKKTCANLAHFLIDPIEEPEETGGTESRGEIKKQDHQTRQLVSDILQKVRSGKHLEEKDLGVDPEKTNFFILGLSPNNARLAVRYWYQDNFGNFIKRVARHHLDMEIERDDRGPQYISVYRLLRETVPQNSSDKASSPMLGGLLMRSILENTPYPVPMYNAMLNRVKVERSINYARAGFIKACLIRLARSRKNHEEDMITVSLNEESQNVPYRLGRLFAVLEKTQSDTNREMKSTINSKYFSSASTTPAVVFPVLLKLAQHHIAKSDWGFKSEQSIQDILNGIDNEFPTFLNLEDQGKFMLGYYHQRKAFFKKKESSEEKAEAKK
jgi:CRISPR-associated protein Csd1